MAITMDEAAGPPRRGLLVPLLIGLILAVAGGAAGFWAVSYGPLAPEMVSSEEPAGPGHPPFDLPEVAFVPLEPLVISLGDDSIGRHLRVSAQLEVSPSHVSDVTHLLPRILDVANTYLRVIDLHELNAPATLARVRAQLLRRMQMVTGVGWISDLLITEFVVN